MATAKRIGRQGMEPSSCACCVGLQFSMRSTVFFFLSLSSFFFEIHTYDQLLRSATVDQLLRSASTKRRSFPCRDYSTTRALFVRCLCPAPQVSSLSSKYIHWLRFPFFFAALQYHQCYYGSVRFPPPTGPPHFRATRAVARAQVRQGPGTKRRDDVRGWRRVTCRRSVQRMLPCSVTACASRHCANGRSRSA